MSKTLIRLVAIAITAFAFFLLTCCVAIDFPLPAPPLH